MPSTENLKISEVLLSWHSNGDLVAFDQEASEEFWKSALICGYELGGQ